MTKHIVIIGGGITGLAAAYLLERAKRAGVDCSYTLLERDTRVGGKVAGEYVQDPQGGGRYIIDGGPDCFSAHKAGARRMTTLLGCEDDWLPSNEAKKKVYIYRDNHLHELPAGFRMFVPTQLKPLLTTKLLSAAGKRDMLRELTLSRRDWAATGQSACGSGDARRDESLESFVVRRFGREVLDYLAEPFIGGVHASDPADMSLAATFPQYLDLEQQYGSVIRGTRAAASARAAAAAAAKGHTNGQTPQKNIWGNTVFASYKQGMHELTDAIAQQVAAHIHTGVKVTRLQRTSDGSYQLEIEHETTSSPYHRTAAAGAVDSLAGDGGGERSTQSVYCGILAKQQQVLPSTLQADAVIIATESFAAAQLTCDIDPELSAAYAGIPNLSSATLSFAFCESDLPQGRADGFGVLVPEIEKRDLLAASWSSTKWPGRAPDGKILIRGFAGTPKNQAIMDASDEQLIATVLDELCQVMNIPQKAQPLFARLYRWTLGMSQYKMGHLDRVQTIEARTAATRGLACAGGCLRGVGIPNCIDGGEAAARKILAEFDLHYHDDQTATVGRSTDTKNSNGD
ncbi:MAG: protoporphyrinogen oxidase [Coriobacteriia bacterium]|nr:protoporphyrinogen oxidase [Coriobacteriia bacterium]